MEGHQTARILLEPGDIARVVYVGMRQDDVLHRKVMFLQKRIDLIGELARVDDDGLAGLLASEDKAIGHERSDFELCEQHGKPPM
jgi:hypothetical protein